jgi:hypothetical protein
LQRLVQAFQRKRESKEKFSSVKLQRDYRVSAEIKKVYTGLENKSPLKIIGRSTGGSN